MRYPAAAPMGDPPAPLDASLPALPATTTLDLVDRVRAGDQEALAILMDRFLPRLRRWASGRMPIALRDLADTSDFVQDVLLQSFQKVARLEANREGGLQAYLRQAVLNRIRDEFRRSRRRPETVEFDTAHPDEGPSPLEAAIGRAGPRALRTRPGRHSGRSIARRSSRGWNLASRTRKWRSFSASPRQMPPAWRWSVR